MNSSGIIFDRTIDLVQDHFSLNSSKGAPASPVRLRVAGAASRGASFREALRESIAEQAQRPAESSPDRFSQAAARESARASESVESEPAGLEDEMTKLSKNSVEYQFMATMLSKKFTMLKRAIGEGA